MAYRAPPLIDMTPDGRMRPPARLPLATKLILGAIAVAVVAALASLAALALWIAMSLLPIAIGAAVVAWVLLKYRAWQHRRGGRGLMRF